MKLSIDNRLDIMEFAGDILVPRDDIIKRIHFYNPNFIPGNREYLQNIQTNETWSTLISSVMEEYFYYVEDNTISFEREVYRTEFDMHIPSGFYNNDLYTITLDGHRIILTVKDMNQFVLEVMKSSPFNNPMSNKVWKNCNYRAEELHNRFPFLNNFMQSKEGFKDNLPEILRDHIEINNPKIKDLYDRTVKLQDNILLIKPFETINLTDDEVRLIRKSFELDNPINYHLLQYF